MSAEPAEAHVTARALSFTLHPGAGRSGLFRFVAHTRQREQGSPAKTRFGPSALALQFVGSRRHSLPGGAEPTNDKVRSMKYGLAWLLGVPPVLIAGWFLLNHC